MSQVFERYSWALRDASQELLLKTTLGERFRVLGPVAVAGRQLYFLDLSTGSPTGTFKDWLACLSMSECLRLGHTDIVTQTSGNTGNSLARYAAPHGVRVTVFYPALSHYKTDPDVANLPHCRFIAVDRPEPAIKCLTRRYSALHKQPWLPTFAHQMEANKLRAYCLWDWCLDTGVQLHWHAQALSSAYGVIGYYRGLQELGAPEPALLGVQQAGRAPFHDPPQVALEEAMFEPTLFRSAPEEHLTGEVSAIAQRTGGAITIADERLAKQALALFEQVGLPLRASRIVAGLHEKAPLLALMGVLQEIQSERIGPGQNVLIAVTGGAGHIPARAFEPHHRLAAQAKESEEDLLALRAQLWGPVSSSP